MSSEPTEAETRCLVEFVYVYRPGQIPPDEDLSQIPDDIDLDNEQFEDEQWIWCEQVPRIGDTREWKGLNWAIASVHPYQSQEDSSLVYLCVCSQSGYDPHRSDWIEEPPILYLPVLLGGQLALNSDGSNFFGITQRLENIPTRNIFQDWEFSDWQRFEPTQAIAPGEFREIVLCWCLQEPNT